MKKKQVVIIIASIMLSSSNVFCQSAEQAIAVDALGAKTWNDKTDSGERCLNYSMGNHRMRLENVNIHKEVNDGKISFWGTLTITNRRRYKADPHVFIDMKVAEGKVQYIKLRADGGGNWHDILPDSLVTQGQRLILDTVMKIGTAGDAQKAMASSIWAVLEGYKAASQQ